MEIEATALRNVPVERVERVQIEIIVNKSSIRTQESEKIVVMPQDKVKTIVTKILNSKSDINEEGHSHVIKDGEGNLLESSQTISQAGLKWGDHVYIDTKEANPWLAKRSTIFTFILVGFCLGLGLAAMVLRMVHVKPHDMFAVVIDAGSSHTSVFTYSWPPYKFRGTGRVREVASCGTDTDYRGPWYKDGISSFAARPSAVKDYISAPCLSESLDRIPLAARASTLLRLGSTAGMRELKIRRPEAADQIMGNITSSLRSTGIPNVNVSIFPGEMEGMMGWVTANYLKDVFGNFLHGNYKESTPENIHSFAAIDWGGSSIQITVEVKNVSYADHVVRLYGRDYPLLSVSHICYGQRRAFRRHQVELLYQRFSAGRKIPSLVTDPCMPASLSISIQVKELVSSPCTNTKDPGFEAEIQKLVLRDKNITFLGQGDYAACKTAAKNAFNLVHCRNRFQDMAGELSCFDKSEIPTPGNDTYFAFSTYWYITNALNLTGSSSLSNFQSRVLWLCRSSPEDLAGLKFDVPSACYSANFMEALLLQGYHFDTQSWTRIKFVKKVADAEVSWSLGYMILATNDIPSLESSPSISLTLMAFLLVLSFLFGLSALVLLYLTRSTNDAQYCTKFLQL